MHFFKCLFSRSYREERRRLFKSDAKVFVIVYAIRMLTGK